MPDLALFPELFGAESVTFKAGVELTVLNYAIAALGFMKGLCPPLDLPARAPLLVKLSWLFKWLGSFRGSFAVWVTGDDGQEHSLAFVAPANGPHVPSAPAVLLTRKLLVEGVPAAGAFPCVGFIDLAEFAEYLAPFGITVVRGENGVWQA